MEFQKTKFDNAWLIKPKVFNDERGFFLETYSKQAFHEKGIESNFIQDNHARSKKVGVLRGLHFQLPPYEQAKLVRVTHGAVFDVIVDIRKDSSTYGQWQGFKLTAKNFNILFIPRGFAHGYCTVQSNTEFMYKVDNTYAPDHDSGILWNDETLAIKWPVKKPILSEKDTSLATFKDFISPF